MTPIEIGILAGIYTVIALFIAGTGYGYATDPETGDLPLWVVAAVSIFWPLTIVFMLGMAVYENAGNPPGASDPMMGGR